MYNYVVNYKAAPTLLRRAHTRSGRPATPSRDREIIGNLEITKNQLKISIKLSKSLEITELEIS